MLHNSKRCLDAIADEPGNEDEKRAAVWWFLATYRERWVTKARLNEVLRELKYKPKVTALKREPKNVRALFVKLKEKFSMHQWRRMKNPTDEIEGADEDRTEFVSKVIALSKSVNKSMKNHHFKFLKDKLRAESLQPIISSVGGIPSFLGSTSAKMVHSSHHADKKWVNVVLYHSPADRALLSYMKEFHGSQYLIKGVTENLKKAAAQAPEWKAWGQQSETHWHRFHEHFDQLVTSEKMDANYTLPETGNMQRSFTLCPFASPNCYAVCLNTSGQGGMTRTGTLEKQEWWKEYDKFHATRLTEGYTFSNDLQYFYLKGYKAFYGGADNTVIAARIKRTHLMWVIWAQQGVLQNNYNDLLFYEAMKFKEGADKLGAKMALRLNGTSDLPVHTLRLQDAQWNGKSLRGKNLIRTLGELGVMCYDYTKDYQKVKAWIASKSWHGMAKTVGVQARIRSGFPSNYYLVYSWSEVNGALALNALRQGCNVVMVFRRSVEAKGKLGKLKFPKQAGKAGELPTKIALAQLSTDPADKTWEAEVWNGDKTDLRFDDPTDLGKARAGRVIGLVAKGAAKASYTDDLRRKAWRHFVNPIVLEQIGKEVSAKVMHNPPPVEGGAVAALDADLAQQAVSKVDGYIIGTTAERT